MRLKGIFSVVFCVLFSVLDVTLGNDICKFIHDDLVFDLSELAEKDYFHIVETLHTDHKQDYYLSICHPLRNAPALCPGENSAVCGVKASDNGDNSSDTYYDGGKVPLNISVNVADEGRIEYIYKNGGKCSKGGANATYTTEVHMICPTGDSQGTPSPVLMSSPGCMKFFAWMTKAACPKKVAFNVTTCMVNFSNSNYLLNLHSLHSLSYYNVSSADAKYEINICGPVTNGHCKQDDATVCQVDSASEPVVFGTTKNMELNWVGSMNDTLSLIYSHNSKSVEIQLFCERTAVTPQLYYVSKNDTTVIFSVRTSVVCSPEPLQCVFTDSKENKYDLRPLHKETGNWRVVANRDAEKQRVYYINICGEVNDEEYYHCPPGPIGACEPSIGSGSAYNLGFITSHPTVNADDSITIIYTGGDMCKNGLHTRSTRINLLCDEREHEPVLVDATETCEYVFLWQTPAACPRHVTIGQNCAVTDPLYGNSFDLRPLRNDKKDYNISGGEHSYLLNLCGSLVSKCNGEETSQSGVCQVKGGNEELSAGLGSSAITFRDGTLVMNFNNGSQGCGGKMRSTQIIFVCDHEESGYDGPIFLEEESCTYHFIWRTSHACPPFKVIDCSYVTRNGTEYDLSELSSPIMNEEYFTSDHSKKFVLNVCRSVVHSKGSRCPYEAAACIVDLKHENDSLSIGEVTGGPYIENEKLKLKYTNGDLCKDNHSLHTETIIEFLCDKQELYPLPQLITEENCKYIFEWATPFACPVTYPSSTTIGMKSEENCKVTNPRTGYVFDLSSLNKVDGYDVKGYNNGHLIINVCDSVHQKKCHGEDIGACTYSDSEESYAIAGKANSVLHFLPGFLFVHYEGGTKCGNGVERATLINFICGAEGTEEYPVLIHDDFDNCTYHINWYTELACERRINCYVDTPLRRVYLSPLIRTTENYEISNPNNPKQKFYLNVCRPLNPITGLLCHPGSSVCLSDPSLTSSPLNLGHPMVTPVNSYEDGIQLMYTVGSECPTNDGLPVTSRIVFFCDRNAGKGNPVFTHTTDCQYFFQWNTSLVCEDAVVIPDSGPVCQTKYKEAKTNVDLKPLQKPLGYVVPYGDKTFKINVCGSACNESGVCTTEGDSYGLFKKSKLNWDYDKLKLTYFGGSACQGARSGFKTTHIYFECDMTAGFGIPVADVLDDVVCLAVFKWKTNVTCMEGIYSNGESSNKVPSTTPTASDSNDGNKSSSSTNDTSSKAVDTSSDSLKSEKQSTVTTVVVSVLVVSGVIFVIVLVLFKTHRGQYVLASARRFFRITGPSTLLLNDVS